MLAMALTSFLKPKPLLVFSPTNTHCTKNNIAGENTSNGIMVEEFLLW
jgi:hypothetical protein